MKPDPSREFGAIDATLLAALVAPMTAVELLDAAVGLLQVSGAAPALWRCLKPNAVTNRMKALTGLGYVSEHKEVIDGKPTPVWARTPELSQTWADDTFEEATANHRTAVPMMEPRSRAGRPRKEQTDTGAQDLVVVVTHLARRVAVLEAQVAAVQTNLSTTSCTTVAEEQC